MSNTTTPSIADGLSPAGADAVAPAESALIDDIYGLIIGFLADDVDLNDDKGGLEFMEFLRLSDGHRTLCHAIPLVSSTFYTLSILHRRKHIHIASGLELERFLTSPLYTTGRFEIATRLEITLETADTLRLLPEALDTLTHLRQFSFVHKPTVIVGEDGIIPYRAAQPFPDNVADAIAYVRTLRVLVLGPGETLPSRKTFARLARGLKFLYHLHIPLGVVDASVPDEVKQGGRIPWTFVRTLSIGSPPGRGAAKCLRHLLSVASFPNVTRINLHGVATYDLEDYGDVFQRIRCLETCAFNPWLWRTFTKMGTSEERKPRLERLVLHVDRCSDDSFGSSFPDLESITLIDDLFGGGGFDWRNRMDRVLERVEEMAAWCPRLRSIHIVLKWGLQGHHDVVRKYVSVFSERQVKYTWQYTRSLPTSLPFM